MSAGSIRQAEVTISTATDTTLVAAPETGQHLEVLELHASVFVTAASAKIRFEANAAGAVLAGLGVGDGATAVGPVLEKVFPHGYKLPEAKGISVESTATATWYVYVKYRLVDTPQ